VLPPIKGFVQNSLIDWPGRIAGILFLSGCNFRCPFCHAAHLVVRPNELESIPFASVEAFLRERKGWVDGVIISGGEPTISEGLEELIDRVRAMGFEIKPDTNGSHPEVVRRLATQGKLAAVSMDIKAPLDERYSRLAGVPVDVAAVRGTIDMLIGGIVADYEFRTTMVPGWLDEADAVEIARTINGAKAYVLQNFQPVDCIDAKMLELRSFTPQEMKRMASAAGDYVKRCWVRGYEEATA
jgi:pyruvate formate lyase activating enzyme